MNHHNLTMPVFGYVWTHPTCAAGEVGVWPHHQQVQQHLPYLPQIFWGKNAKRNVNELAPPAANSVKKNLGQLAAPTPLRPGLGKKCFRRSCCFFLAVSIWESVEKIFSICWTCEGDAVFWTHPATVGGRTCCSNMGNIPFIVGGCLRWIQRTLNKGPTNLLLSSFWRIVLK